MIDMNDMSRGMRQVSYQAPNIQLLDKVKSGPKNTYGSKSFFFFFQGARFCALMSHAGHAPKSPSKSPDLLAYYTEFKHRLSKSSKNYLILPISQLTL